MHTTQDMDAASQAVGTDRAAIAYLQQAYGEGARGIVLARLVGTVTAVRDRHDGNVRHNAGVSTFGRYLRHATDGDITGKTNLPASDQPHRAEVTSRAPQPVTYGQAARAAYRAALSN